MDIFNVEQEKRPIYSEEKLRPPVAPNSQPKLVLGGNDRPRPFAGHEDRPKQQFTGTSSRPFRTLKERMNKEYPFKRESVAKLFRQAVKVGLQLPECKRPEEAGQTNNPNYCPYHQVISHPIEDCYVFKEWLERKYKTGEFTLSDSVLVHPRRESTRVITHSPIPSTKGKSVKSSEWEIVISKKTTKMLKQLEAIPDVKWKSPLKPVFKPRNRTSPNFPTPKSFAKVGLQQQRKLPFGDKPANKRAPSIFKKVPKSGG